ncbi:hypothetical protein [Pseudonocardia sp.]|uniref:hypothetical protein n=1 Tax=Pseudonocardia sp. TaxID=60912 RepID=UPI0031FE245B
MPRRAGPVHPVHHFPIWYADENGKVLELALATDDPNLPGLELENPGKPLHFPENFPDEAFYSLVEAEMIVDVDGGTTRARLVLALEAAFGGTGEVADGQQMVFGRVRFRLDGATPGDRYTATHPYNRISAEADEKGDVDITEDIGCPQLFPSALRATPWPFVSSSNPPAGYLGDGATTSTITGAPADVFAIDGPGVSASGRNRDPAQPGNPNRALTRLFTVRAKKAARFGVDVRSAVLTRDGAGAAHIDVIATSRPGQDIQVTGEGFRPTPMRADGERYVARIAAAEAPAKITVTNVKDDPPFPFTVPLTDAVTIADAVYDLGAGVLTVEAVSSRSEVLRVFTDLGDELGVPGELPMAAPPPAIEVQSAGGGRARADVRLRGEALPFLPVAAAAGPDQTVPQGRLVRLDGSGSAGATQFVWEQVAGPVVVLIGGDTAVPSFVAPAENESVTLRLTATRPGGEAVDTATDEVTVDVEPLTAPIARSAPGGVTPVESLVTVDGSGSAGAATFAWTTGPGGPELTGADGPVVSFTMPRVAVELTLTVDGDGGDASAVTVEFVPEPDQLLGDQPQFRARRGEWRLSGTSSARLPNRVTASLGTNPGDKATEIGSAAVDVLGEFDIRRLVAPDDLALRPGTGALVTLTSTRGGTFVDEVEIRD